MAPACALDGQCERHRPPRRAEPYGPTSAPHNERDYVALPPCVFGHQPGLQTPWTLEPHTNLLARKYFNNTYRHLGQMAQWTGLATYASDPF